MTADMPSSFWSGWIIVITVSSLIGLAWLILSVYFAKVDDTKQIVEPIWDESLREGSSAPPMWWFWMLFASLVFTLIYLMLYPGLGSYGGLLNWSQGKRMVDAYENFDANFADARAAIVDMSLAELQNDLELMQVAERIFKRECSACHGPEGRGQASLFPNLHDVDWQWGGSPEQIETSIRAGRNANMIAWGAVLGDKGIDKVAPYVQQLSSGPAADHPGKVQFEQMCAACHGIDGGGNPALGAPNLSDDIWLYGGSLEIIKATLHNGRFGVMPAFNARLDDTQIKLLVGLLAR
ncbi:MAG: cytochrome c oxidase cbb3-type subunit 3 [Pseudohongiellaceae bacterium]|jgi:cytochrome c oxidase cbb3-type subunit 3